MIYKRGQDITNSYSQDRRDEQGCTEICDLLEQNLMSKNNHRNQCWGRTSWTITYEFLEQVNNLRVKNSRSRESWGEVGALHNIEVYLQYQPDTHNKYQRKKFCLAFGRVRGKGEIFLNRPEHSALLNKAHLRENYLTRV